ncbi:MAG: NADH-quinone oxidoreductase subunit J [Deltaproteobacteria bacterium]|nr:NADH-quinone oxidoreductase subunit J [Deltaproteobacteria bacterium]
MSGSEIVFYVFAAVAVVSAIATVTRKNPVVAAVWLVATFFAVAVNYVLLSASFLAVLQVLVYAGAMMVLFVFVIMVLDVDEAGDTEHRRPSRVGRLGYSLALLLSGGMVIWVLVSTLSKQFITPGARLDPTGDFGSANAVGRRLFTDYLFAFEGVSLLLLAAVIGAVVVARSRREREKEAAAAGMSAEAMAAAGLEPPEELVPGPNPQTDFGQPSAGGHEGGT